MVVAYGMFLPPKAERKILQSALNADDKPFSGPFAYGVTSRILNTVQVPY